MRLHNALTNLATDSLRNSELSRKNETTRGRGDRPIRSVGGHGTTTHRMCKSIGYKIRGRILKTCRLGASLALRGAWVNVDSLRVMAASVSWRELGFGRVRYAPTMGGGGVQPLRRGNALTHRPLGSGHWRTKWARLVQWCHGRYASRDSRPAWRVARREQSGGSERAGNSGWLRREGPQLGAGRAARVRGERRNRSRCKE